MPLSQFVTIFLLEDVTLLLYTVLLIVLKKVHNSFKLKKNVTKLRIGQTNQTGSTGPGLLSICDSVHITCSQHINFINMFFILTFSMDWIPGNGFNDLSWANHWTPV